jgi:hypothetical protein
MALCRERLPHYVQAFLPHFPLAQTLRQKNPDVKSIFAEKAAQEQFPGKG